MQVQAKLYGVRLSAQKGRLVADLVRGQPVGQRAQHPRLHPEEGRQDHQEGARERDRQRRAQQRRRHRRAEDHHDLRREGPGAQALPGARQGPRQPDRETHLPRLRHGRRREKGLAMGQKINPIGFRLSVNRNWGSKWFANTKNFPGMLAEDIKVREYLEEEALARRRRHGRDRAPVQERAHHHLLGAPGRGHRQEGRGHRGPAQRAAEADGRAGAREHRGDPQARARRAADRRLDHRASSRSA